MAVLGQNIRTGPREVEIDSIKSLIVVLTPGPADAVSVLPLVRYCGEHDEVFVVTEFQRIHSKSERRATCPITPLTIFHFNL